MRSSSTDTGSKKKPRTPEERLRFVEMVRKANAPAPPEHSVLFRVATTVAVVVGILACESVGELSTAAAASAIVAVSAGMAFSYATRQKPWQWLKLVLAAAVLTVFGDFVIEIFHAAHAGQLATVEVPLAALFTWVQVIHAFDVPARRDLLFSLAAAAALVTVAGAQAVTGGFLGLTAVWLVSSVVALGCSWRSMSGSERRLPALSLATSLVVVL
ncbi:MAG: hypothetical protein ACRDZP_02280, partial [Acidimicrobiales bacterium]